MQHHCPAKHRCSFWSCVILNEEPPHAHPISLARPGFCFTASSSLSFFAVTLHRFLNVSTILIGLPPTLKTQSFFICLCRFATVCFFHLLVASLHVFVARWLVPTVFANMLHLAHLGKRPSCSKKIVSSMCQSLK
jgi:hypothetical protein